MRRSAKGRRRPAAARLAATAACALLLTGCGLLGKPQPLSADAPLDMSVSSPEFTGGVIPARFTCHGTGESPPLTWSGQPSDTRALALVMDDAGAPITPYAYWIVFNISPATPDIQAGRTPPGSREAVNSKGTVGYAPPCPARSHQYRFNVYALNAPLRLPNGASLTDAWSAIASHAIARGRLQVSANP